MHNYAYKCVLLRLVSRVIARGCDHAERQVSWLFIYCSFLMNVCFSVMLLSSSSSSSSSSSQKASALTALCPKVTFSYTHFVNCSLCTKTQVYTAKRAYTVNKKKPGEVHTTPVNGNRDCCHCRFTHAHCNLQPMHQDTEEACTTHDTSAR